MPHDFVPRADGKFLLWVRNLVEQLQSDPDGYQMPADMVQQLAMLTADFETAYAAITRATRCPSLTQRKNEARREAESLARKVAGEVRTKMGMPEILKFRAGLSLRGPGGYSTRLKRPDVRPRLSVRDVVGPVVTVWLINRANNRHTLPHRQMRADLYVAVGEFLRGGERWQYVGGCTVKKDIDLSRLKLPAGSRVWLAACWRNTAGAGPRCWPVPARLTDGMVMNRRAA
jgi:hypothetical protein